jgi:hypothetical protein
MDFTYCTSMRVSIIMHSHSHQWRESKWAESYGSSTEAGPESRRKGETSWQMPDHIHQGCLCRCSQRDHHDMPGLRLISIVVVAELGTLNRRRSRWLQRHKHPWCMWSRHLPGTSPPFLRLSIGFSNCYHTTPTSFRLLSTGG